MLRIGAIHVQALGLFVLVALSASVRAPGGDAAPRGAQETRDVSHTTSNPLPRDGEALNNPPNELYVRIVSPAPGSAYARAAERSITLSGVASPSPTDAMAVYSWYYDLRGRGVESRRFLGSGATLDWYPGTMGPCTERGSYDVTLRLEALSIGQARDAASVPPFKSGVAEVSVHLDCGVARAPGSNEERR